MERKGITILGRLVFPGGFANLPKPAKKFMTKHHYVYRSYEEEGREYIGIRSCNCLPEKDIGYFGSFRDKTFSPTEKTILFICETRKEASEIEIELHDFFDVAVNPKFANRSKATSTRFDVTGVILGPRTERDRKKISDKMSGRTFTKEWKQIQSERMTSRTGALHPRSKAIIAIKPDGTELLFVSGAEAAKELGINHGKLSNSYLKTGRSPKWGKFKGWQFLFKNSENF
jgi:hypothetical protein